MKASNFAGNEFQSAVGRAFHLEKKFAQVKVIRNYNNDGS